MIPTIPFATGFLIYALFCVATSKVYSQKYGKTNPVHLFFIYVYYSILAVYLLWQVEKNAPFLEFFVQAVIYVFGAGIVEFIYYRQDIMPQEHRSYS